MTNISHYLVPFLSVALLAAVNADRSNAILFPTWLGGRSEDLLQFTKPGGCLDTQKHVIVLIDAIGDGVISSPANSTERFRRLGRSPVPIGP